MRLSVFFVGEFKKMSYFDEARAILAIIKMRKLTQSELARQMGVSQSFIANKIRLLNFSPEVEKRILAARLSERHARSLLRLKNDEDIFQVIEKTRIMGLNVRACEVLIDTMTEKKATVPDYRLTSEKDIRAELENSISSALTKLTRLGKSASQSVSFYNNKRYITISIEE